MQAFTKITGLVAPLDQANVDTDQIIPKQFLKSIKRSGFGPNLFDAWRYLDEGQPGQDNSDRPLNPKFVLNEARYQDAKILLTRTNFGCGSSREHAPWALLDYGFSVLIAPSFADIFYHNCFKNGILPITLSEAVVEQLMQTVFATPGYRLSVDLARQEIIELTGVENSINVQKFELDGFKKYCLLNGLDDIGLTLQQADDIRAYEAKRRVQAPWIFSEFNS